MDLGASPAHTDLEVTSVTVPDAARLRLREIGVRVGARVRVTQRSAFGGRVVAVAGTRVALDRATATRIEVREVTP